MDFDKMAMLITALFGSGGIIALLKARSELLKAKSEIRNANKSADIEALRQTLVTLQESYAGLQDRYQEGLNDYQEHCSAIEEELKEIKTELQCRIRKQNETEARLIKMQAQLDIAKQKIAHLEQQLEERDNLIMMLQQENMNLRKNPPGCREGLQKQ